MRLVMNKKNTNFRDIFLNEKLSRYYSILNEKLSSSDGTYPKSCEA